MNNNSNKKKTDRQNLYVTVIVILMMVAVVVAIATSLAKNTGEIEKNTDTTEQQEGEMPSAKGDEDEEPALDTEDVFFDNEKDDEEKESEDASDTEVEKAPAVDTEVPEEGENVSNILPDFIAPVAGEVLRGCSLEAPVFSQTMEDYRTHTGVDLYCEAGSDVAAAAGGTVKEVWEDPMMGTCISIEHSGGAVSVYKNLYEEIPEGIEAGTEVRAGQIIATAGDTALLELAEESHLHFELSVNGEAVDPAEYIEFSSTPVFEKTDNVEE